MPGEDGFLVSRLSGSRKSKTRCLEPPCLCKCGDTITLPQRVAVDPSKVDAVTEAVMVQ